jgi:hypothetical protein
MKDYNVRHEVVLVLTPEMIEKIRRRNRVRKIQIAAAEFAAKHRSHKSGVVDLGDLSEPVRVTWEFWKIERSQYHYREPGQIDLGKIE